MDKYLENIIDEKTFKSFVDESISLAGARELEKVIALRFRSIVEILAKIKTGDYVWFDFDNFGGADNHGKFDLRLYSEEIRFCLEGSENQKSPSCVHGVVDWENFKFNSSFPTSWLYSDFEFDLCKAVAENLKALEEREKKELQGAESKRQAEISNELKMSAVRDRVFSYLPEDLHIYIKFLTVEELNVVRKKQKDAAIKKMSEKSNLSVGTLYELYRESGGKWSFDEWILKQ